MITRIKEWINENINSDNPINLFIIDLRLHEEDFTEEDPNMLSGIQIVEYIKSKNRGIQVVVYTASNKVWNYQKCMGLGVKHFSIKESPETFNSRKESKSLLKEFLGAVTNASDLSYLADLHRNIEKVKKLNLFKGKTDSESKLFHDSIFGNKGVLDQIFALLSIDGKNDAIINQCLLLCFQVLENYCDLGTVGSFGRDNLHSKKLASGFVWKKEKPEKMDIFINTDNDKINTCFELVKGNYDFQTEQSSKTPITFIEFEKLELKSSYDSGLDTTALVKIISVLRFRDGISKESIEKIMELRYYRSKVAAHYTGDIKASHKITHKDIVFFIDVFTKILVLKELNED